METTSVSSATRRREGKGRRIGRVTLMAGAVAAALASAPAKAETSVLSVCTGVSLPKSVVTDIVGGVVVPVAAVLDTVLGPVVGLLGLSTNLSPTLGDIADGKPVQLNVLDADGNVVSTADCPTVASSFELTASKGISMGGGKITGLGNIASGNEADAGEIDSIAIGNRAKTHATAARSIAIGPDASVGPNATGSVALGSGASATAPNSVALGANSVADQPNTVSVGSPGNERRITNVADGAAPTDAVNMRQFDGGRKDANAGTASAMAMASMPQASLAGKSMAAAAISNFKGQSALAVGVSSLSDNGRWVAKLNGSANTRGDFGISAGIGMHW